MSSYLLRLLFATHGLRYGNFGSTIESKYLQRSGGLSPIDRTYYGKSHHSPFAMAVRQNGGSSTCVEQPQVELQDVSNFISRPQEAKTDGPQTTLRLSDTRGTLDDDSPVDLPSPTTQAAARAERWNQSRLNVYRTFAAFWSFIVMGSNDAAYGALIPYVRPTSTQKTTT